MGRVFTNGPRDLGSIPGRIIPKTLKMVLDAALLNTQVHIIGLGVRVFANGPGDLGSIPGRVIPKTQKMVLDASLLSTQHYKVRIKGKVEQSRKGVAPSPTHWCSSYRKGSLRVTLDYGRQLYFYLHIKGKVEQSRERSGTLPCCSYWKGSLLVTLDYSCQLYFTVSEIHLNTPTTTKKQKKNMQC